MFKRSSQISSTLSSKRQYGILKDKLSIKVQPFLEQRLWKTSWCTEACATSQHSLNQNSKVSPFFFLQQKLKESESTRATLRYTQLPA